MGCQKQDRQLDLRDLDGEALAQLRLRVNLGCSPNIGKCKRR